MKLKSILKTLIWIIFIFGLFALSYSVNQYLTFNPEELSFSTTSTKVYDNFGELLYQISFNDQTVKNTPIELNEVSQHCIDGIVATEDQTFWSNIGVDFNGTIRMGFSILTGGIYRRGGSTISQQVIKLADQDFFNRGPIDKLREIPRAIKLNQEFSKEEILEMYFNNAYFGNFNYGIESASQDYFGISSSELDLAQCSYLVGLPQRPSTYNPYANLQEGLKRQETVLKAMENNGYISESQMWEAMNQVLEFTPNNFQIKAPHFIQLLQDNYGIKSDLVQRSFSISPALENLDWDQSYNLETYYDYDIHLKSLNIAREIISSYSEVNNASIVILNSSGELKSLIGSIDFFNDEIDGKFNSALGKRQPGRTLTPLLYSVAFRDEINPSSTLPNQPFSLQVKVGIEEKVETIEVENSSGFYSDEISVQEALYSNLEVPVVNLVGKIGSSEFENFLINSGIEPANESNWCNDILIFEGCETSLLDLTRLFLVLQSENTVSNIKPIRAIYDLDGDLLLSEDQIYGENFKGISSHNADFEQVMQLLDKREGEEWSIFDSIDRHKKDMVAVGFNNDYVIGVWVGNTDGTEFPGTYPNLSTEILNAVIELL